MQAGLLSHAAPLTSRWRSHGEPPRRTNADCSPCTAENATESSPSRSRLSPCLDIGLPIGTANQNRVSEDWLMPAFGCIAPSLDTSSGIEESRHTPPIRMRLNRPQTGQGEGRRLFGVNNTSANGFSVYRASK